MENENYCQRISSHWNKTDFHKLHTLGVFEVKLASHIFFDNLYHITNLGQSHKFMKKDFIWYASAQSANRFPVEPIICPIFSKFSIQNTFIKHQKNNFQRQIENLKISEIQSLPLFDYLPKCKRSHFFELNTNISSFGPDSRADWLINAAI